MPSNANSRYCSAYNCRNNDKDNKELSFFRFPIDTKRYV